jgi:uracil-DNA glycosylase
MGAEQHDWRALAASALDWWRDAGVDTPVGDAPRNWFDAPPAPAPMIAAPPPAPTAARRLPDTLPAFLAWRLGPDAPDASRGAPVAPEGPGDAAMMVVVDCPEGAALLDDDASRLFDRMLAAIGLARSAVHLAALTPTRPLAGRVVPEVVSTLAPLLRHHVALVRPRVVLSLNQAASRALIGTDVSPPGRNLHPVNLESGIVQVVASLHPRFLLEHPAQKAAAWRDLLLLKGGLR